jgi:hypothetical protein
VTDFPNPQQVAQQRADIITAKVAELKDEVIRKLPTIAPHPDDGSLWVDLAEPLEGDVCVAFAAEVAEEWTVRAQGWRIFGAGKCTLILYPKKTTT